MSDQEQPTSGALYTCISCQVAFQSAESQRNHYRSDWHRYNLKRKVVNLPPVTLNQFNAKAEGIYLKLYKKSKKKKLTILNNSKRSKGSRRKESKRNSKKLLCLLSQEFWLYQPI